MADRAPLAGWALASWNRQSYMKVGGMELWAAVSHWSIEITADRGGASDSLAAAKLAAEDAARAMVAEMAAALGGSVTWADAQEVSE